MKSFKLILTVLPLLLLAACGGGKEAGEGPAEQVSIEDFHYTLLPGGARVVSGRLHNRSSEPIRNAQIQIALFDGDNRLVSTMSVDVRDVEPGQQKAFRQPVDGDDTIQGAKVRGVLLM